MDDERWEPGMPVLDRQGRESRPSPSRPAGSEAFRRVQRFRQIATPEAFGLAVLLAAAPLSLPLMRRVQAMLLPAWRHRIQLRAEAELEGVSADTILRSIMQQVQVPL